MITYLVSNKLSHLDSKANGCSHLGSSLSTLWKKNLYKILHVCSCIIDFIKPIEKKRSNVRFDMHFYRFLQRVE